MEKTKMTKTEYEKELEREIEKLENTVDSRIGKHKNIIELKITNKKSKLKAYKKGKQDGYNQAIKETYGEKK
ncbi:MAG: hypothetical protein ACOCT9_02480 [archaeon]